MATQTECLPKDVSVQVSGCRECLTLLLPKEGGRDTVYVRCDMASLVAELKEGVEK